MKRLILLTGISACLLSAPAWSNEPAKTWSLEECIRYAIEHNIDLKQRQLDHDNKKVELHTSKYSWLPDLNANIGQLRLWPLSFEDRCNCRPELSQQFGFYFLVDADLRRFQDSK